MKTLLAVIGWDGICQCCTELLVFLQQICKSIFTYNSELVCRLHVTVIAVFRRSVYSYKTDGSNFTPVIKINRNETNNNNNKFEHILPPCTGTARS